LVINRRDAGDGNEFSGTQSDGYLATTKEPTAPHRNIAGHHPEVHVASPVPNGNDLSL
jgi:hypothetical protein